MTALDIDIDVVMLILGASQRVVGHRLRRGEGGLGVVRGTALVTSGFQDAITIKTFAF